MPLRRLRARPVVERDVCLEVQVGVFAADAVAYPLPVQPVVHRSAPRGPVEDGAYEPGGGELAVDVLGEPPSMPDALGLAVQVGQPLVCRLAVPGVHHDYRLARRVVERCRAECREVDVLSVPEVPGPGPGEPGSAVNRDLYCAVLAGKLDGLQQPGHVWRRLCVHDHLDRDVAVPVRRDSSGPDGQH